MDDIASVRPDSPFYAQAQRFETKTQNPLCALAPSWANSRFDSSGSASNAKTHRLEIKTQNPLCALAPSWANSRFDSSGSASYAKTQRTETKTI